MRALRFRVADRLLAVDLHRVREVCPCVRVRSLPTGPAWLLGVIDHHGRLVPTVDGGVLLGRNPVAPRLGARIVLLEATGGCRDSASPVFGLLVDAVEGVVDLTREDAWRAGEGLPDLPFLVSVSPSPDGSVLLLDPGRIASLQGGLLERSPDPAPPPAVAVLP